MKRLQPPAHGQLDVFDQGFPGLALRVSYGGRKSWTYFYRLGGKLRRMTMGTYPALSLAAAREAWREARQDVARGRDPSKAGKQERPATNFAAVADEWLRRDQAKNRSHANVKRILFKDVVPAWQHRQISEIGRRDVLDLIDAIADRGAVSMARQVHAHLHRLFRWCVGRGIIEANPMTDLPKPGSNVARDRVLSDEELVAIWKGCDQLGWPFGTIFQLLMLTGARREEIGGLQWTEISDGHEAPEIRLEGARTKNGERHTIPISKLVSVTIGMSPHVANSDFVFTTNGKTAVSGWSRAKSRLDAIVRIEPWVIHDLRRSVATGMQKLGVGLQVVEAVLGHVSGSRAGVVGIYQRHSYDHEKRAALTAWAAHLSALLEGRQARQGPVLLTDTAKMKRTGKVLPFWWQAVMAKSKPPRRHVRKRIRKPIERDDQLVKACKEINLNWDVEARLVRYVRRCGRDAPGSWTSYGGRRLPLSVRQKPVMATF